VGADGPGRGGGGGSGGCGATAGQRRRKRIELVGREKIGRLQGQLECLTAACVGGSTVVRAEDAQGALAALCPRLTDLALPGSLVRGLVDAAALAAAAPLLASLDLSGCRLDADRGAVASAFAPLGRLSVLVLHRTGLCLGDLSSVAHAGGLAGLESLHVGGNLVGDAGLLGRLGEGGEETEKAGAPVPLPALRALHLEESGLASWSAVRAACAGAPVLVRLGVTGNPRLGGANGGEPVDGAIKTAGGDRAPVPLGALETLWAGGCGLASWSEVDALGSLSCLTELRLSGCPVAAGSASRHEAIARLSGLRTLNGSAVRPAERRDAEVRYARAALGARPDLARCRVEGPESVQLAAEAGHPRLPTLLREHGDALGVSADGTFRAGPSGAEGADGAGCGLAGRLVQLTLTCVAVAKGATMGSKNKKLPSSTTLAALGTLTSRLFGVPVGRQALFLKRAGEPQVEALAGWPAAATLAEVGAGGEGCEILIDEGAGNEGGCAVTTVADPAADLAKEAAQLAEGDALRGEARKALGL